MDFMTYLYLVTFIVGTVLSIVVIFREKKGIHHWLHYAPIGISCSNLLLFLEKLSINGKVSLPIYASVLIYLIIIGIMLFNIDWIYGRGKI